VVLKVTEKQGEEGMHCSFLVQEVQKPEDGYEDFVIMEFLELYEEEDYDWSRVRFFRVLEILETNQSPNFEEWGPSAEIYQTKVGDTLTVLDSLALLVNDFTLDVEIS
jgi:hypothetical protein